jgi:hypothetical protein
VKVSLHRPVEIHRPPDLVQVLGDIARAYTIAGVLYAVLGDENRQVGIGLHSPLNSIKNTSRNIGNEFCVTEVGAFGKVTRSEQAFEVGDVKFDRVHRIIVKTQKVLRAFRFRDMDSAQR